MKEILLDREYSDANLPTDPNGFKIGNFRIIVEWSNG